MGTLTTTFAQAHRRLLHAGCCCGCSQCMNTWRKEKQGFAEERSRYVTKQEKKKKKRRRRNKRRSLNQLDSSKPCHIRYSANISFFILKTNKNRRQKNKRKPLNL